MTRLLIREILNRVQEANTGDETFARLGGLRLHVVHLEPGLEVYSNEVTAQYQIY